ncbi:septum formation family protein [Micromonospora sp. NBC_01699]|uniref:septum formation family protein n=1 Tax=Micromonospora sp. NBC_01699 TaxID=2975984 RepID=UPI002E288094|nr:septum formation family protein [Micromonospora sp. NBC_01699]
MRRWWSVLVAVSVAGVLLSGCGQPAGIDGALVDDWAPLAEPKPFVPPVGTCHPAEPVKVAPLTAYEPVDCAAPHRTETVHVGTFSGAAASREAPPAEQSAEIRTAFGECDGKAREYVGNEWRAGRLRMEVALPSPVAWTGGARWFRCDMAEVASVEPTSGAVVNRTASVRGALKAPSPLALACYSIRRSAQRTITGMPAVDCAKPHNSEFVGVWNAPEIPFPTRDIDWVRLFDECRKLIATYVGAPDDANMRFRTDVLALPGRQADWQAGNRGVRCYLGLYGQGVVSRSVKGAGLAALPVPTN